METRSRGKKQRSLGEIQSENNQHEDDDKQNDDNKQSDSVNSVKNGRRKTSKDNPSEDVNNVRETVLRRSSRNICIETAASKEVRSPPGLFTGTEGNDKRQCHTTVSGESKSGRPTPKGTPINAHCAGISTEHGVTDKVRRSWKSDVSDAGHQIGVTTRSLSVSPSGSPSESHGQREIRRLYKPDLCCDMCLSTKYNPQDEGDKNSSKSYDGQASQTQTRRSRGDTFTKALTGTAKDSFPAVNDEVFKIQHTKQRKGKETSPLKPPTPEENDITGKVVVDHTYANPTSTCYLEETHGNCLSECSAAKDNPLVIPSPETLPQQNYNKAQDAQQNGSGLLKATKRVTDGPMELTESTDRENDVSFAQPQLQVHSSPADESKQSSYVHDGTPDMNTDLKNEAVLVNERLGIPYAALNVTQDSSSPIADKLSGTLFGSEAASKIGVKDTAESNTVDRKFDSSTPETKAINGNCCTDGNAKSDTLEYKGKTGTDIGDHLSDSYDQNKLTLGNDDTTKSEHHDTISCDQTEEFIANEVSKEPFDEYHNNKRHDCQGKHTVDTEIEDSDRANCFQDVDGHCASSDPNVTEKKIYGDFETSGVPHDLVHNSVEKYFKDEAAAVVDSGDVRDGHLEDNIDVTDYCEMVVRNSILLLEQLAQETESCDKCESDIRFKTNGNNDNCLETVDNEPASDRNLASKETQEVVTPLPGILYYTGREKSAGMSACWYVTLSNDDVTKRQTNVTSNRSKETAYQCQFVEWLNQSAASSNSNETSHEGNESTVVTTDNSGESSAVSESDYNTDVQEDTSCFSVFTNESLDYVNLDLWSELEEDLEGCPDYNNVDNTIFDEWQPELDNMLMGNKTSVWRPDDFRVLDAVDPSFVLNVVLPTTTSRQTSTATEVNGPCRDTFHYSKPILLSDGGSSTLSWSGDDKFSCDDSDLETDLSLSLLYDTSDYRDENCSSDDSIGCNGQGKHLSPLYKSLGLLSAPCQQHELENEGFYPGISIEPPSSCLPEDMIQEWNIDRLFEEYEIFPYQDVFRDLPPTGVTCCSHLNGRTTVRRRNLSGYEADEEPSSQSRTYIQNFTSPSGVLRQTPSPFSKSFGVRRTLYLPDSPCSSPSRHSRHSRPCGTGSSSRKCRDSPCGKRKSEADDLADLSVENTVEFFMKMSSPLKSQEDDEESSSCELL